MTDWIRQIPHEQCQTMALNASFANYNARRESEANQSYAEARQEIAEKAMRTWQHKYDMEHEAANALRAQCQVQAAALAFYADPANWEFLPHPYTAGGESGTEKYVTAEADRGSIARAARGDAAVGVGEKGTETNG